MLRCESIDHCGGHGGVSENLAQRPEGLVGRHDHAGSLVAGHHAEVVSLKGDSYTLKDEDLGRVPNDDAA